MTLLQIILGLQRAQNIITFSNVIKPKPFVLARLSAVTRFTCCQVLWTMLQRHHLQFAPCGPRGIRQRIISLGLVFPSCPKLMLILFNIYIVPDGSSKPSSGVLHDKSIQEHNFHLATGRFKQICLKTYLKAPIDLHAMIDPGRAFHTLRHQY